MPQSSLLQIFLIFLKLGCTSFGGPIAHLGFFRQEFVQKRRWLDDATYAEWVALCQFLPGPASSQLGMAIGFGQARLSGAFAAWLGFTLPSALMLMLLAYAVADGFNISPFVAGLKIIAVAVVAQALWGMSRSLVNGVAKLLLLTAAALISIFVGSTISQLAMIIAAGLVGFLWLNASSPSAIDDRVLSQQQAPAKTSLLTTSCGLLFLLLLAILPLVAAYSTELMLFDSFYRAGALVFGGGHVVLPLLEAELVSSGLVNKTDFVAAYGAAQAVPGPLFTIAGYLGVAAGGHAPLTNGLLATIAIFLPGFLLVLAVLPWWQQLRLYPGLQRAVGGINAAVVGILLAAWYDPVLTTAVVNWQTAIAAILASAWLTYWRRPVWQLVLMALLLSPWLS
ncbi:MAG: chromate efflux transporter [Rheinheimera sp.]